MLQPPSLRDALKYPVTTAVAALAVAATASWWAGKEAGGFVMDYRVWEKWELWRALTSTLPHADLLHLAFNLYWLWVFGTLVERVYGELRMAGIVLLLASGSALWEFAVFSGGVGLSGVGYGLWAMLWVLERRDRRFAAAVDRPTTQLFVGWFFLCILLTVTKVMLVGNVAHAVGAGLGALLGLAASGQRGWRWASSAGLVVTLAGGILGSTVLWPRVNLTERAEAEVEHAGVAALERTDDQQAAQLLETAVHMRWAPARAWYNLGVAYHRLDRDHDAVEAFERAARMPDATQDMQTTARQMREAVDRRDARQ
jgi:membrane associated rhomboid family serine protease